LNDVGLSTGNACAAPPKEPVVTAMIKIIAALIKSALVRKYIGLLSADQGLANIGSFVNQF
tara:strand:- start:297 stop:479 length:183 start_codon:yes stop_codon:yes gene_type:complete